MVKANILWVGAAAIVAVSPIAAHHGVNAQYDVKRTITVTGVLRKIDWINPHAYFHFDVKNKSGKIERWSFESPGPNALRRAGLSDRSFFVLGETYTIRTNPARDGSRMGTFGLVTLPNGRVVNIEAADPGAKR